MKNVYIFTAILLLATCKSLHAQTPVTIVKPNIPDTEYIVTGSETLTASESITLKSGSWIKSGSTFIAKIESDAYRALTLSNENYIYTRVYQSPMNTSADISKNSDVIEKITYFDGFGRPIQNIGIKASPSFLDIVTHVEYDSIGRQKKEYLPYMDSGLALASYKIGAKLNANNYYTLNYPSDINSTNPNPFSQKQYDNSPLNRVTKQAAAGTDWAIGSGHEVKFEYQTNIVNEVKKFNVKTDSNGINSLVPDNNITYLPNQLYKKVTKDENWKASDGNNKTTEEFIDKEGHVVLKKTYGQSIVNDVSVNTAHETYYVYDNYGNLTYVVPPLVDNGNLITNQQITSGYDNFSKSFDQSVFTGTTSGGGGVTVNISDNVLTVTFSAGFNSSMLSSTPQDLPTTPCLLPDTFLGYIGTSNSYSVSITNGKLVITNRMGMAITSFSGTFTINLPTTCSASVAMADKTVLENLCYQYKYDIYNRLIEKKIPGKGWEYIVYDKLDRPILTQDANLKSQNKWLFIKYDAFNRPVYTGEYIKTSQNSRAEIQALADGSTILFENKQGSNTINNNTVYYTNNAFPNIDIDLFTINYYDNYEFDLNGGTSENVGIVSPSTSTKSLATGSKVRVLGTTNWITNVIYYDEKGRAIYNYSKNDFLDVTQKVKTELDFVGKPNQTTTQHIKGSFTITILDSFTYDHVGRLKKQTQSINGAVAEVIAENSYDELGQLTTKGVGGKINQSRLQNVDYAYNIRGWLKGINDSSAGNNDITMGSGDLFGFKINYNNPSDSSKALYNGNISQTFWKTANTDSSLKSYTYSYDALNRLTLAESQDSGRYNESLGYDKNGNIMNLVRKGYTDSNATILGTMDNLVYDYNNSNRGNKLMKVADSSGSTEGFKDGNTAGDDYSYDDNGNMIIDLNKGIKTAISYNHLNLPTQITFATGNIQYVYDATGVKLEKKVVENGKPDVYTKYAGSFIYEKTGTTTDDLKFFSQPEGYVAYNSGAFDYIYQYKDHLGNIRLSYDKNLTVIEENNYYPFGLKQKGYNNSLNYSYGNAQAQKYKYNGKELQDELGLNVIAMDYRQYDSAIGRFYSPDVLSELAYSISPYRFAFNNPVYFSDPTGLFETRKEAREYKRQHHISGGISRQNDGTFAINDKKNGISYSKGDDSGADEKFANDGVQESVLVQSPAKKESNWSGSGWPSTVWGTQLDGDSSGWNGTRSSSVESSDFITPGNSGNLNNEISSWAKFLSWLGSFMGNSATTVSTANSIIDAKKANHNTSTMEVQNKEPVIVTSSIKVVSYTYHLNDSTTTANSQTATFKGDVSAVKRQIDSVKGRNESRASDKEAWLKSWGK